jgi:siroheme synthase-like protein
MAVTGKRDARKRDGYPVLLDLHGRDVLVVGAGAVASRKAAGLIAAGARVHVVGTVVLPPMAHLDPAPVRVVAAPYDLTWLEDPRPWLVVTATDDPAVNTQVAADAEAVGIWVNSADDPTNCGFILPAIHRQGDITIAVSTGGAAPALAQYVRDRIAEVIGPAYGRAADVLRRRRDELHAAGQTTEGRDWRPDIETAIAEAQRHPE